jgi:hypothetical protein
MTARAQAQRRAPPRSLSKATSLRPSTTPLTAAFMNLALWRRHFGPPVSLPRRLSTAVTNHATTAFGAMLQKAWRASTFKTRDLHWKPTLKRLRASQGRARLHRCINRHVGADLVSEDELIRGLAVTSGQSVSNTARRDFSQHARARRIQSEPICETVSSGAAGTGFRDCIETRHYCFVTSSTALPSAPAPVLSDVPSQSRGRCTGLRLLRGGNHHVSTRLCLRHPGHRDSADRALEPHGASHG